MHAFTRPLVLFTLSLISTLTCMYSLSGFPLEASVQATHFMNGLWLTSIIGCCATLLALFHRPFKLQHHSHLILPIILAFFVGACLFSNDARHALNPGELTKLINDQRLEAVIKGQLISAPIPYESGWAFEIITTHVDDFPLRDANTSHLRIFYPIWTLDDDDSDALLPLPGDHIEGYVRLERFALADLPGDISMRTFMENRGIAARATAREVLQVTTPEKITFRHRLQRRLTQRRIHLERNIGQRLPAEQAAIAMGMLTASRGLISSEFRHPFDITGTSHLLAISGLHLAVLAGALWFILGWITNRIPWLLTYYGKKRVCGPIIVLILIAYVFMIGAPVSAQRALLMLTVAILGYTTLRPFCAVHAIAAAALILILLQPTIIFELGFQLSFLATAGIILFMRTRPDWMRKPDPTLKIETKRQELTRRLVTFIGISFAATLSTWPAIVIISGELPVAGLWLNLLVVPAFSTAIFPVMATSAVFLSSIPAFAAPALNISTLCIVGIQHALDSVAYWPGSTLRVGNPIFLSWVLGTFSVSALIIGGLKRRSLQCAAITALFAIVIPWCADLAQPQRPTRIHFIPVGQGDSTFIELPDGTNILVDAGGRQLGPDPGLHRVLPYLKSLGIRQIDYILVSHAHLDHFGGFNALIRPFRPRYFIYDAGEQSPAVAKIVSQMQKAGTELIPIDDTANIKLDHTILNIIRPGGEIRGSTNDMSLVVSFQFAGATILLPGDIEQSSETWLLENNLIQPHTIVKLPHHGSKTSSTPSFVNAIQPKIGIISAGKFNQFGHPHPDVITRYATIGAQTLRTDINGLITIEISHDGTITLRSLR